MDNIFKYRVWDNQEKTYLSALSLKKTFLNDKVNIFELQAVGSAKTNQSRYEIESFTGIYDDFGKPIFKGDIIDFYNLSEVHCRDYVVANPQKVCLRLKDTPLDFDECFEKMILGNIHQDRKLLDEVLGK